MFNIPIPDLPAYDSSTGILDRPGHDHDDTFAPGGPSKSKAKPPDPALVEAAVAELFTAQTQAQSKSPRGGKRKKGHDHEIRLDVYEYNGGGTGDTSPTETATRRSDYRDRRDRISRGRDRTIDRDRESRAEKKGTVICCPCENPCPEEMAKDCLYVTTMLMNILYATVCAVFLFALTAVQFPENEVLGDVTWWLTILAAGLCVVCFVADAIICCRLDVHSFMDQCPLIFWIVCNVIFLLVNLAQLAASIILSIQYEQTTRAREIEAHHHPDDNTNALKNYCQDAFAPSLIGLLAFGLPFLILRTWFVLIVNHARRVMTRKYSDSKKNLDATLGATLSVHEDGGYNYNYDEDDDTHVKVVRDSIGVRKGHLNK